MVVKVAMQEPGMSGLPMPSKNATVARESLTSKRKKVVQVQPNWLYFWVETLMLSLLFGFSLAAVWAGANQFQDWDHVIGWYEGRLDLDGYIPVDPARFTVHLTQQDIDEHRFTPATLKKMEDALIDAGVVLVTGGSIWTDEQLDELDALTFGELDRAKAAAAARGLTRPPWSVGEWYEDHEADQDELYEAAWADIEDSGFCKDCPYHEKKEKIHDLIMRDPMIFPKDNFSYSDAVSISYGRIDMPHFLNFSTFQKAPYYNRSDLNQLCETYSKGMKCETTLAGALWNFPGSFSALWHQDAAEYGHNEVNEVTGTLTTAIASRNLPENVGWVLFQPFTHDRGEWSHLVKSEPPNPGEPAGVTIPMKRGEMLFFTDTTKHTVTPNPTNVDRGIVYVLYGSQKWEDTPWHGTDPLISPEVREKDPMWRGPIHSRKEIW
eukprot:m.441586 g.441586  ORF g.441586 m.441586 type:complete len:436 (-) comp18679_c0_seq1:151-1458(-)